MTPLKIPKSEAPVPYLPRLQRGKPPVSWFLQEALTYLNGQLAGEHLRYATITYMHYLGSSHTHRPETELLTLVYQRGELHLTCTPQHKGFISASFNAQQRIGVQSENLLSSCICRCLAPLATT